MAFTADEVSNINNAVLETFIDKGTVFKQYVANKPMLEAFNASAGSFAGGKDNVSFAVKAGQGTGSLAGYEGDDAVSYYNPTGIKRARFPWKEHHIGITVTHTELKTDGIDISDDDKTSSMDGREDQALANLLEEKLDTLGEDYAVSLDSLIHGDGTSDTKALAGISSIILDNPAAGTTGTIGRSANVWWRNRARTASSAGGTIASSVSNGGALIAVLESEYRQLSRYKQGQTKWKMFAGSDFIDAYLLEIRANGKYSETGFRADGVVDGGMTQAYFKGIPIVYDPTLDSLSKAKRCYWLDMGRTGVRLLYMNGQRMKKHNPARPYDRYVMYNGITMTGVMVAKQLNTSGVYDIT